MKSAICLMLAVAAVDAARLTARSKEHPVERVIDLLHGLSDEVTKTLQEEEVEFAKFSTWCTTSQKELKKAIAANTEQKATLEEDIAGNTADIESLSSQISGLEDRIVALQSQGDDAQKKRDDAHAAYEANHDNLKATISSIDTATEAVENAGTKLVTFLQTSWKSMFGQPAHTKYKGHSSGVVDTLEHLSKNFEDEKNAVNTAETNAENAFNLAKNARDAEEQAASTSKSEKETQKGETERQKGENEASLSSTTSDLEADTNEFNKVLADCQQTTEKYNIRKKTQEDEKAAMAQAIKIMSKHTGAATAAPGSGDLKFLQLTDPKQKAVELLRATARRTHSKALKGFADLIGTYKGPFDTINNDIQKMIFRLQNEQKEEDDHKNWCDQELAKTTKDNETTTDNLDRLNMDISQLTDDITSLTQSIADENQNIADDVQLMEEATEIRQAQKEENKRVVKESSEAQAAIAQATSVLRDFYKNSGAIEKEPYEAFVQSHGPVELSSRPDTWDSSYTGVQENPEDGIIAMLESAAADFSEAEADTKEQEQQEEALYQQTMSEAKIRKAKAEAEVREMTSRSSRKEETRQAKEAKAVKTTTKLEGHMQYLDDLQKACVDGDSSYEDRKAARDSEIKGLEDALTILKDAFKPKM